MDVKLNAREVFIIQQRRQGKTLAAIGAVLGISRERVRQLLKQIQNKLASEGE